MDQASSFSAQVEGSDRSISSTSRLRVGIHHDWRLRLQTTTYVRPKSATRAEVYLKPTEAYARATVADPLSTQVDYEIKLTQTAPRSAMLG